ncbi:hypothetical protein [Mesorhizobium sp. BE184]|uniref:hypothetical protein n=1 Tax=Mesorhizobium sp. BE184 TaxID=2817714 RepID=UPI002854906C|nr:hypothetical protein [Mesorhizobium sp. BE184]MDR7034488.1 hypothetical protein [Mesorhizobium sp. BE184]
MTVITTQTVVISAALANKNVDAPVIGWDNQVARGAIAATSEAAFFPANNLANPSTAERWQAASNTTQYLTFTTDPTRPCDYVGIARHNLGSNQNIISVEVPDPDNEGSWLEAVPETLLGSDAPALLRFEPGFFNQVRLRIQGGEDPARIAVVYVGKLLVLQRGLQPGHVPLPFALNDDVSSAMAESGDFLGRIVTRQALKTSVSVQLLEYNWFIEYMAPFVKAARTTPFFFAWMPTTYPDQIGYAWVTNDIRPDAVRMHFGIAVNVNMDLAALAL